ncbi:MAG TPA: hypothetical protein VL832_21380 [Puia sp.]|nr:hypothetical protein [Puia sp.]
MITRYNYEEFFLLYVDNELSAADRQIVERFVAENPDLKEEWDILLHCRVRPDHHLVFTGRDSLLKQEGKVDADNYEEYFLSYIDGELEEEDRRSVEEFVRRHPSRLDELERLQQTVSVPDNNILFEHKELLYKKEKDRRFIILPWRIAAAALVAGVTGLLIFNSLKKGTPGESVTAGAQNKTAPGKPAASLPGSDRLADVVKADRKDNEPPSVKKDLAAVTSAPSAALHLSEAGQAGQTAGIDRKKHGNSPVDPKKEGASKDPGSEALAQTDPLINRRAISQIPVKVVSPGSGLDGPGNKAIVLILPAANEGPNNTENSSFATQALLSSAGGSPEDGFDTESSSTKKNKLRGLFRKVSRVLEKNTSRDEDDKRSVQIGGFQFALK